MSIECLSSNQKHVIKIEDSVIALMEAYRQTNRFDVESGGILLGRTNLETHNIVIEHATYPMIGDKQTSNRFYRKAEGHIAIYKKLYDESGGIYAYLGEWHTHPEKNPDYSSIDKRGWVKIGKEFLGSNKYFYHIIVGISSTHIWEYNGINGDIAKLY